MSWPVVPVGILQEPGGLSKSVMELSILFLVVTVMFWLMLPLELILD